MSAHGHATPGDAAASHDHHYEGIPADRPAPDEPRTPLWLPLVGLGLFLFVLLAYVMTRPPGKTGVELAKEAAPEASAAPAASVPPSPRVRLPGLMGSAFGRGGPPPGAAPSVVPLASGARPMASAPVQPFRPSPRPRSAEPRPPAPAQ